MSIRNAKIIGTNISPILYHERTEDRGHKDYIMSHGELLEFSRNSHRWISGYKDGEQADTKAQEWGSLVDCILLTPDRFDECYAVAPETYMAKGKKKDDPDEEKVWNWNATVCKEWKQAQGDKTVIKSDTLRDAHEAVKVLLTDQHIHEVLHGADFQVMVTAEYHDADTKLIIPVRTLIDILPTGVHNQSIADLKTCCTANLRAWQRAVYQFGYYVQGAFYMDIYNAASPKDKRIDFLHILSESFSPWEIGRRMLSEEFLQMGRLKYQDALKRYCQCLKSNYWPGYDEQAKISLAGFSMVSPEAYMVED